MLNTVTVGETVKFSIQIQNLNSKLEDPTGIKFKIKYPDNTTIEYPYGNGVVLKEGIGRFYCNLTMPMIGKYVFQWETSAPKVSIRDGELLVVDKVF